MTISSVANVQVSARISHSGNAIEQAGDLIGNTLVSTSASDIRVSVIISK